MPRQTFSASFCPSLLSTVVLLPGPLLSSTVVSSLCSCRAPTSPLLLLPLPPFSSFFRLVISSNLSPQTAAIRESGRRKFPRRIAPSDLFSSFLAPPRGRPHIASFDLIYESQPMYRCTSLFDCSFFLSLFLSFAFSLHSFSGLQLLRVVAARKERSDR